MKFFIHDKCMEKLIELPKNTAKKVLEFRKKFRENSKSAAIHLEPISTFKDPQLRTARIDDKYRAIIRVPESGDHYHLLWVDNHDEAMDWAKNKVFQWNAITQTAQIFTSPESITEEVNYEEEKPQGLFASYGDDQLLDIGVPDNLLKLVKSVQDLNELEKIEKFLPEDSFENLFYLSEGINVDILIAEIREGISSSTDADEQFNSINNKRSFVEVDDDLVNEFVNGELSKWQIFLHPSQRKLVESSFKASMKVTGGAGTGKTVVAMHRLKHLISNEDKTDGRKILFTTFTNALTNNLKELLKKLQIDPSRYILNNIDAVARELGMVTSILTQSSRVLDLPHSKTSNEVWETILDENLSEFDISFLSKEYQEVILYNDVQTLDTYLRTSRMGRGKTISRKAKYDVWSLVEKYEAYKAKHNFIDRLQLFNKVAAHIAQQAERPYKHVIADEIQDMSNVELRFLRSLTEERGDDLFLVGDPYQRIYDKKLNFSKAGISVRGKRSKQLRINYRTTEEIKKVALTTIKGLNYDDFDGEMESLSGYLSLFHGSKPTYSIFVTKDEEHQYILEQIEKMYSSGMKYSDMVLASRTRDALKELKTLLHNAKLPYRDITAGQGNAEGVSLSTFHGMKGLEFKAVILSDVNNRTCPLLYSSFDEKEASEKEAHLNSEKSLMYVAMTRAVSLLYITGTGVKSELVGL
jgi:superfamily I DNA/RNA helicase